MSEQPTRQTSLPPVPLGLESGLDRFLRAVFENMHVLTGRAGDPLDASVRYRDLTRLGLAATGGARSVGTETFTPDNLQPTVTPVLPSQLTRPPVPQGLQAVGGFDQIYLSWTSPSFAWLGATEIWRADDNNLSHAVKIGTSASTMYVDKLGGDESLKYYWIRHTSRYQAEGAPDGPFNETPASARLALNVSHMISILTESYRDDHPDVRDEDVPLLFVVRPVVTVGAEQGEMVDMGDGVAVFVPSGVYITRAAIARATITTAQIKDLSADKITTGTIQAGETITVGGAIQGGKDAYGDASPGWWVGDDAGTYKLIVGNSTSFLRWDGDSLKVQGQTAEFDDLTADEVAFNEANINLGKSNLHYVEKLVLSNNDYKLLVPSITGAALSFDDPDRASYLCYLGGIYAGGTTANSGGTDDYSAYVTPGVVPHNYADPNTYARARNRLGFAGRCTFYVATAIRSMEMNGCAVGYRVRRQSDSAIVDSGTITYTGSGNGSPAFHMGCVDQNAREGASVDGKFLAGANPAAPAQWETTEVSGSINFFKTDCISYTDITDAFRLEITSVQVTIRGTTYTMSGAGGTSCTAFDLFADNGTPLGAS